MQCSRRRAISPVIATILLVVLVISASIAALSYYRSIKEEATQEVEGQVSGQVKSLYAGLRITEAYTSWYTLKNTGSVDLYDINVYEEDTLVDTVDSLEPGDRVTRYRSLTLGNTLYAVGRYADDKRVIASAPIMRVGAEVVPLDITGEGNATGFPITGEGDNATSNLTEVVQ